MATEKRKIHRVIDAAGNLVQVLPETSAEQVTLADAAGNFTSNNVEGALAEVAQDIKDLETGFESAGKVDDVQDVNGSSIVTNKIAKLTKAAVGLGNVDNTADANKSVKHATSADSATTATSATTANSATKATQDASGNVITSTYATKNELRDGLAGKANLTGGNAFTGNQSVTGSISTTGGLTVGGNLTVSGTTTTVDSTTLQVKDKLIEVAHGNTTKLTTPAGLVAPKYDGTNSGALVFDGDGIASVGDVVLDASGNVDVTKSNLQPLATRTGLVDGNLVKYDGTNKTLVDTGKKVGDLVTTNTEQEITAAKTFKDEYGTVVINGEITYTPAAASIGGLNINNDAGDRVIGVFANEAIGELCLGSSTGKEAHLLLKGEPGEDGQVLVSRGTAKTPAWSNSVGQADSATNATNVTTSINNKAITSIFENDGTTVKKATSAGSATTATTASKLAHPLLFGTYSGSVEKSSGQYLGNKDTSILFSPDFSTAWNEPTQTVVPNTFKVELKDTLTDINTVAQYSAMKVDAKGRVTAVGYSQEFGTSGQKTPSENLMLNGIFWELQ